MSDFYEVLGVRRDADQETIKQAFRERSRALHPDVSSDPQAPARFRAISEAYSVLSRPESRRLYDRFGWRGRGRGLERRRPRVYATSTREFLQDLETLISAALGQPREQRPAEVVATVELDPYEAHVGAVRSVHVTGKREAREVPVPPRVRDLDRVFVGPDQVAIVRIVPVQERILVRTAALAGLLIALGFLLFLLAL
jgi:curved DNA-binding protein CbpA